MTSPSEVSTYLVVLLRKNARVYTQKERGGTGTYLARLGRVRRILFDLMILPNLSGKFFYAIIEDYKVDKRGKLGPQASHNWRDRMWVKHRVGVPSLRVEIFSNMYLSVVKINDQQSPSGQILVSARVRVTACNRCKLKDGVQLYWTGSLAEVILILRSCWVVHGTAGTGPISK